MKIIDISGENGISSLDSFSIKKISQYLYKMTTSNVEDSSTGPSTYIDNAGSLITVPAETPVVIDGKYVNVGAIENIILYSNDFNQWSKTNSTILSNQVGPSGSLTAVKLCDAGTSNCGVFFYSSGVLSGKTVFSVIAKASEYTWIKLRLDISGSFQGAWFDLANGVVGTKDAGYEGFINHINDGWYECSIRYNAPLNTYCGVALCDNNNTLDCTKATGSGVFLYTSKWTPGSQIYFPFVVSTTGTMVTTASRAGTIAAPMEVGDKLYSLLDGKADGQEIISSDDAGWTELFNSTIDSGIITILAAGLNAEAAQNNSTAFVLNEWYEVSYEIVRNDASEQIYLSSSGFSSSVSLSSSIGTHKHRVKCTIDGGKFRIAVTTVSGIVIIKNISCKKISLPSFKLTTKWTPKFDHSDLPVSTTGNILHSGTQAILQFRTDASGNGYIDLTDGTYTTSVVLDWEYDTQYDIQVNVGWNEALSAYKMQLIVDGDASTLSDFDGSFNPGSEMIFGYNTDYHQHITKPVFYKLEQRDWEANPEGYLFSIVESRIVSGTISTTESIVIDWGDGNTNIYNGTNISYSHTYSDIGLYYVTSTGKESITKLVMSRSDCKLVCSISDLPSVMTYLDLYNTQSVLTGDVADLPSVMTYLNLSNTQSTMNSYTRKTWVANMKYLYLYTVSPGGLDSTEVDNLLIDLAATTWTVDKKIYILGTNAARTSASDSAVATLISMGVSVTTN